MNARVFMLSAMLWRVADAGQISLLNQDSMVGEIVALEGGALRVRPVWGGEALNVYAARMSSYDRAAGPREKFPANVRLDFANGDHVEARLRGVEGDHVLLETAWNPAARVRIGTVIRMTGVDPGRETPVAGIGSPADWRVDGMAGLPSQPLLWRDGALHLGLRNTMARRLSEIPERFVLDFRYALEPAQTNFGVSLDLFSSEPGGGNRPWMRFQFSRANMFYTLQGGGRNPRQAEHWREFFPPELFAASEWHVRLYGDFNLNRYVLKINGLQVHDWVTEEFDPPRRDAIRWVSITWQHGTGLLALEEFSLSAWDGVSPRGDPVPTDPEGVAVLLRNGDVIQARLVGTGDEALKLETAPGRTVSLPWRVVARVTFPAGHAHPPRVRARDVRVLQNQRRDRLTLSLESWEDGTITGTSDIWVGPQRLRQTAVDSVQFNIHMRQRPQAQPQRESFF